jgi:hypothetical protein
MPSYDDITFGLRLVACLLGVAAAIHLYLSKLRMRYRVLFAFLCFHVIRSLSLFVVSYLFVRGRNAYAWTWMLTEPLMWIFYVLLILELYSLVLEDFKGLKTVGRWIFYIALPVSILISFASVIPNWQKPDEKWPTILYFIVIDRGVMFGLVVFTLVFLALLSSYPIRMSRNLIIHIGVMTAFLISASLVYLVRNVGGHTANALTNMINQIITVLVWSTWLVFLTPKGEAKKATIHRQWSPSEEERLVNQLTAINSSLLRATRK